ncbi:MAG: hypothetical protein ABIN89_29450 [Chitinophagaceae bacterium]
MIINRYNYQELFLLYVDNELDAVEKKAVENFIQQNADLEAELRMLQQSILRADQAIVFENKKSLLRFNAMENNIHAGNWEEFSVRYTDDELGSAEKLELENFIQANPRYQQGFGLVQSLKFTPDEAIVFPDKESLYRHEKDNKPVILPWWQVSAAALVLLFAGVLWLNNRNVTTLSEGTAKILKPDSSGKVKTTISETPEKREIAKAGHSSGSMVDPSPIKKDNVVLSNNSSKRNTQNKRLINKSSLKLTSSKKEDAAEAINKKQEPISVKIGDDLKDERKKRVITLTAIDPSKETAIQRIIEQPGIKTNNVNHQESASAETIASTDISENIYFANIPVVKKNSFRSVLRRASRLIDKTTSFKTSKKSSLLIGNVEIAFQ